MFTEEMFAQRVMELRERLGVSQRDMSLSMGQGAAYINNIENRRALPSMTGFFYMCDYLKIEPKEFFDLDNTNPEITEGLANHTITPEAAATMYDYTAPLIMLASLGVAALIIGIILKRVDRSKGLGLELPNIKE